MKHGDHLKYNIIRKSDSLYEQSIVFPFVNTQYVNSPFEIQFDIGKNNRGLIKRVVKNALKLVLSINFFGKRVVYTDNTPLECIAYMLRRLYKYRGIYISDAKCDLPNLKSQVELLENFLNKFFYSYNIKNSDIFIGNFIRYIDQYIGVMDFNPDSSSFISGSNSITSNRIISSYFLEQGLKSVSIAHGEHDALVFDDPYTGYAEISYCTDYISYGSDSLDFGSYNRSLKGHKLRIHWRSSIVVENNISRDEVKKINNTKKGLYIPTGFSGNVRYGPFRDMSDESHLSWQNKVGSAGVEMYYKQHPLNVPKAKEKINSKNLFLINKDCNQNLRDLDIEEYDFITLDYMSTAFAICSSASAN